MNICYTLHYSLGFCFGRCKNIKIYVFLIILNFICKLKKTEQEINNYQSKKDILRIVKIKSDSSSIPVIPTIGWQRQASLCEFKASLAYKHSSMTARAVT